MADKIILNQRQVADIEDSANRIRIPIDYERISVVHQESDWERQARREFWDKIDRSKPYRYDGNDCV
jgi:predicted site-specific integrase-resolvase